MSTVPSSSSTSVSPSKGPRSPTASRRRVLTRSGMIPQQRLPLTTFTMTSGSTSSGISTVRRSPVLLECSHGIVSGGYAGQAKARRTLVIPWYNTPGEDSTATPEMFYRRWAPLVHAVLELLAGGGHQDLKERRIVVLYEGGLFVVRAWKEAMERIILHDIGAIACCLQPILSMIPMAFPPEHFHGMLVIHLTLTEAHCVAYTEGHCLQYTYQACSSIENKEESPTEADSETVLSLYHRQLTWLRNGSLIRSILLCLAACPRETRRSIVHNIVVVGAVVDSKFYAVHVAQALRDALQPTVATSTISPIHEETKDTSLEVEHDSSDRTTVWIQCPLKKSELHPLAEYVSVLSLDRLRPDWIPWLGASVWASHWHNVDPDSPHFQWITPVENS